MAKKKSASSSKTKSASIKKLRLIVSDQSSPSVTLKPGMKLDVISVSLVDPSLKPSQATAARLCGGTSTCIALIETND